MFEDRSKKRTELGELGEFGLIDHLCKDLKNRNASTIKGVGDDAAVIDNKEKQMLVSTDLLVEGIHFDLSYTPLKHLGYKAAVVNFSDIVAMNGTPKQLLVAIAVSNRFSVEALEELYDGIKLACEKYKVDLVGGDTTSSTSGLFISMTILGEAAKEDIVYRNGAQESNLLCVSGNLGAAYLGLLLLEREKEVYKANPASQPELLGYDYILQRQLKPEARLDIIKLLKENNIKPTAMIDISDGLASEILHICKQSDKGCSLYEDKIPIDASTSILAEEFKLIPTIAALSGGEDYEVLFTAEISDFEKLKSLKDVHIIGHITDKNSGANLITSSGAAIPLTAQGWDALKENED
ncbi:MAG: thiamine-phosphate kinase [Bacteroidetes bacterium]|nr:thiamine-phosphate kinase [Bacteroidota bacterium]